MTYQPVEEARAPVHLLIIGGDYNIDDRDLLQAPSPGEETFLILRKAGFVCKHPTA